MVTKPKNSFKTPPTSRGSSPARANTNSRGNSPAKPAINNGRGTSPAKQKTPSPAKKRQVPLASPNKTRRSPSKTPPLKNVGKSPIRSRGTSPGSKSTTSISSNGTTGSNDIKRFRRPSESGSIERLDEDNNLRRIITSYNQDEDNINVVVRVRPLSNREIQHGDTDVVQFPGNGQILIEGIPGGSGGGTKRKLFSYNVVFEQAATQEDVLQYSGMKRLIEMAVEGFRCTCFCYGQTGSGKTHTLTGPPGLFGLKTAPYSDKHGLIFRSFMYLFQQLQEQPDKHFVLKASYLEIYNEKVIDLLNPGTARKPLAVRWSKKARGFFVENLFTVDCEELDDLIAVLEEGLRNRSIGRHNMNEYSSRSHTILTVHITSEQPAENGVFISRTGKINFVDLAGSEMTKKTQSEGKTLEEANNINKSLMVLGYCISSLSDSRKRTNHIPYRDSKLTKLLADSLAGNGVTLMIACISPAKSNLCETLNTLRYAARAKKIRTKPIVVMEKLPFFLQDPREALILSLKREVDVLQTENEHLRAALNGYSASSHLSEDNKTTTETVSNRAPPHVDLEELNNLEGHELIELVRLYLKENEILRKENVELYTSRDMLQRDHELVCRENERLLKKVEELNPSPVSSGRQTLSADGLNLSTDTVDDSSSITNIWTNPDQKRSTPENKEIPDFIQKEMDKRLGSRGKDINTTPRGRPGSCEDKPSGPKIVRITSSKSEDHTESRRQTPIKQISLEPESELSRNRRFSVAKAKNTSKDEVFGSAISLTDDEDL
ncbi:kinesin-like protein at 54D isoform X1 [Rhynchophorus ferrugineus]|uniref:kinesin-like protein at 54D isoform X1 n=1 Tax=Rhynchophorus ferrugineus TaxID=354439 RepID=UPI003FCED079